MRELDIGTKEHTKICVMDKPSYGGACHEYEVQKVRKGEDEPRVTIFSIIRFQRGPIKEHGVNGNQNEDLIAIVIDRLEHFQAGDYACAENLVALEDMKAALVALRMRTNRRTQEGSEGTSVPDKPTDLKELESLGYRPESEAQNEV